MAAIQEDVLMGEEQAREEQALREIEDGNLENTLDAIGQRNAVEEDDDYEEDDYADDQEKLETVGEGNETNLLSTGENGGGLHNLRDADSLPDIGTGQKSLSRKEGASNAGPDDDDDEYAQDGFDERNEDDYEF